MMMMGDRSVVIRSVARALRLLDAMNERQPCTLAELNAVTGLPKPTIFRILATLQHEGYVVSEGHFGQYRVTAQTRRLGAAYSQKSLLVDVGAPLLRTVTRQIKWPLALGVLEGDAIVVRYSTMPYSPLAMQATTLGHRLGLLESAMGMAYLAFCDATQLEILLDMLRAAASEGRFDEDRHIASDLALTRQRGYGLRLAKVAGASATVAVPILLGLTIVGVLSMTTFGSLMNEKTLSTFLPILKETAQKIAQHIAAHEAESPVGTS
jgi:IclR family mhp operon transcriptional activator